MKGSKTIFLILIVIITVLSGCSFFSRADVSSRSYQKSGVNPVQFKKSSLKFSLENSDSDSRSALGLYHGDILGDSGEELIVVGKDYIKVCNLAGEVVESGQFEGMNFGSCVVADIDEDGKKDIVIGSAEDKGVRILIYSGVLAPVADFAYSKMYNGRTSIHFVKDGVVYFSAVSSLYIPPKITGAYDIDTDSLLWEYYTGPVPVDMAADSGFKMITISNTPKSKKGLVLDERNVADHSKYKGSIYVLGSEGGVKTQLSIGPEYRVGEFQDGGISSVTERFIDADNDGTEELLVAVNRVSGFYRGNAELQLRSLNGELTGSREFSPNTEIEFSFYHTGKNPEIAVLLKQTGKMYVLNGELEVKKEAEIPDFESEGTLQESGDYNGDGRMEYLVTAGRMLYILDSSLDLIFSMAADTAVKKAFLVPDSGGKPVLAVLSDDLCIYRVGSESSASISVFSDPPGADLYMNGVLMDPAPVSGLIKDVPPGKAVFQAKMGTWRSPEKTVKIKGGQHYTVNLKLENYKDKQNPVPKQAKEIELFPDPEIPLKNWEDISLVKNVSKKTSEVLIRNSHRDLAGDSGKDFIFFDREKHLLKTVDSDMNLLCEFKIPADCYITDTGGVWPDTDGNGKADIVIFRKRSFQLLFYAADGKLLRYKRLGRFPDTVMGRSLVDSSGIMMIDFNTGYVQQPRGIMGVDLNSMKIDFFYPVAANPIGLLRTDGGMILSDIHTPSNGCRITYPNGTEADDSEYFVYMMDENGNPAENSFNPGLEGNNGQIFYYSADMDSDGNPEVYFVGNKTNYYSGRTEVRRLDIDTGKLSGPLFSPGDNLKIFFHSMVKKEGKQLLAVYQSAPRILNFLDSGFKTEMKYDMAERDFTSPYRWFFADLNSDGNSEMFLWNKTGLYIYDLDFNQIAVIGTDRKESVLANVIVSDLNSDGKDEITLVYDDTISVYSY